MFGLTQRTKWASADERSAISDARSLMNRRPIELNVFDRFPFAGPFAAPSLLLLALGKSSRTSGTFDASSSKSNSCGSVSLFFSSHDPTAVS